MFARTSQLIFALLSFLTVLIATSSGAATTTTTTTTTTPTTTTTTPDGTAILVKSLALASHEVSFTMRGTLSGPGVTLSIFARCTPKASGLVTTVRGGGTSDVVEPNKSNYGFVRANSIAALRQQLEISNPTSSEVNVWFKVTSKDSRFADFFGGASTVAQTFSFGPIGWMRSAAYEGNDVLRGVPVYILTAESNMFVANGGYNEVRLYVTDSTRPLPFAMTGPITSTGLLYFSKWNSTTLSTPTSTVALPH
jgi:hypothetical protein